MVQVSHTMGFCGCMGLYSEGMGVVEESFQEVPNVQAAHTHTDQSTTDLLRF